MKPLDPVETRFGTETSTMPVLERWVIWHITRTCNIECNYCYGSFDGQSYKSLGRDPDELTTVTARGFLSELSALDIDGVHINGGEPLMRPDLSSILEGPRSPKPARWLLTNGTIRGQVFNSVAQDGLVDLLAISLDTCDPTLGNVVRDRSERALQSLDMLADWKRSGTLSCRLGVYVVVSQNNLQVLGEFAQWLISRDVDYVNVQPVFLPSGHPEAALSLGVADTPLVDQFFEQLETADIRTSSMSMRRLSNMSAGGRFGVASNCFADRGDYFYVSPSGVVHGCPVKSGTSIALGSLHRQKLGEIIRSRDSGDCGSLCGDCLGMYEMATSTNAAWSTTLV
jgi:MoaA/NifB/PqqE/SkfB family radical SAM enzyme